MRRMDAGRRRMEAATRLRRVSGAAAARAGRWRHEQGGGRTSRKEEEPEARAWIG
jgi:hypothetical protein